MPSAPSSASSLRASWRALRLGQWAKNGLVILPAVLSHRIAEPDVLGRAALAVVAFGLCASGGYVVNDLLDRERDRRHPSKRSRPFASGALPAVAGLGLAAGFVGTGLTLAAATLPTAFTVVLGAYLVTTMVYSVWAKGVTGLDVVILAGLYVARVLGGGAATGVPVSDWFLGFSLFFFLGLALLKRYAELRLLESNEGARDNGRGYTVGDIEMVRTLGPATGLMATLVLAIYLTSPEVAVLYGRPRLLWLVAPLLLYWTLRAWFDAHRGRMPDEPVLYTVKDPVSWTVGAATAAVLIAAAAGPG